MPLCFGYLQDAELKETSNSSNFSLIVAFSGVCAKLNFRFYDKNKLDENGS
jgi:hypothetical protein